MEYARRCLGITRKVTVDTTPSKPIETPTARPMSWISIESSISLVSRPSWGSLYVCIATFKTFPLARTTRMFWTKLDIVPKRGFFPCVPVETTPPTLCPVTFPNTGSAYPIRSSKSHNCQTFMPACTVTSATVPSPSG